MFFGSSFNLNSMSDSMKAGMRNGSQLDKWMSTAGHSELFNLLELESGVVESPRTPRTPREGSDGTTLRKVLDLRRQLVMQFFEEEKTFFPSGKQGRNYNLHPQAVCF